MVRQQPQVTLALKIPRDLYDALQRIAWERGTITIEVMTEAFEAYRTQHQRPPDQPAGTN